MEEVKMTVIGLLVFVCFATTSVFAIGTILCHNCHNIQDPSQCLSFTSCGPEEQCSTEVHFENGQYLYTFQCKGHHGCEDTMAPVLVGRRAHHHGQVVCKECCGTNQCDRHLCNAFLPTTTTAKPTTTTTQAPTTTAPPACRDHQEDGFSCHDYDKYDFCTDTNSLAYDIAHGKCPKHCGFCDSNGNFAVIQTTLTMAPVTTTPVLTTTATAGTRPKDIPLTTTTAGSCVDFEDSTFLCKEWASHGFCTMTSGQGFEIAKLRCKKFCGFCA